ncbi:MAG: hypothetical protein GXO66_05550 [Euryarchaeota archaeon]|nr:hypothetical protein [Euryarchaeota archaeon]
MRRGFIFTMDAILAMIPVFIVIAAATTASSTGGLLGQQIGAAKETMVASNVMYLMAKQGLLEEVSRDVISGNTSEAREAVERWLEPALPDNYGYRLVMRYSNGTEVVIAGDNPPQNASISTAVRTQLVYLGREGYLGQAWYVGIPPSINIDTDNVMGDKNGDGVVNASDQVYLGECRSRTSCTYDSTETDGDGWYYFNFTVPGEPVFTVFIINTNSDHHRFYIEIKNNRTGGAWQRVVTLSQVWYSAQVDLTKWVVGNGWTNQVRLKVWGNAHALSFLGDRGNPYEAYLRGNSKIISLYGSGMNVKVVVNDSSTDSVMANDDFTLTLTTPDPSAVGSLTFSRLYLPAGWHTYRIRVWVDGDLVFNTGYGYFNWDNVASAAILDLTSYLKSPGTHTLRVRRENGYWYASPTLIRTYVKGPKLLQIVNLPYNPPWPNPGGYPSQTYSASFSVPAPDIAENATISNAVYILNADEDSDKATMVLNGATEISGTQYGYERYKFVTGKIKTGSNTISTTLENTKGDGWYVQGPGNQLLIGYELGKLAFGTGPGPDVETAKKNALEQLLIKMGYDSDDDGSISGTELDTVK